MSQTPGPSITGYGGWGTAVGRPRLQTPTLSQVVPELSMEETGHLLLTAGIGLVARNPYVSLGVGALHLLGHQLTWTTTVVRQDGSVWVDGVMVERPRGLRSYEQQWMPVNRFPPRGGGPGGFPNLHRPSQHLSIEETGEILTNPPVVGQETSSPRSSSSSTRSGKRRKSCPPGYRWDGRRCVKKG